MNRAQARYNMAEWHAGRRKENVKACSDQKLELYRDVCAEDRYYDELHVLLMEANRRGLA